MCHLRFQVDGGSRWCEHYSPPTRDPPLLPFKSDFTLLSAIITLAYRTRQGIIERDLRFFLLA
jgi:hypothetical protein